MPGEDGELEKEHVLKSIPQLDDVDNRQLMFATRQGTVGSRVLEAFPDIAGIETTVWVDRRRLFPSEAAMLADSCGGGDTWYRGDSDEMLVLDVNARRQLASLNAFRPWLPQHQYLVNVTGGDFGPESRFELVTVHIRAGALLRAAMAFDSRLLRLGATVLFYSTPRFIADTLYDLGGRIRHSILGKRDEGICQRPSKGLAAREWKDPAPIDDDAASSGDSPR